MASLYYDSKACRQFNMLGAYIGYYEKLPSKTDLNDCSPASTRSYPPDCLGHTQEPTKGCDSTDSEDSPESSLELNEKENATTKDASEAADANDEFALSDDELLSKLKDAESTILSLQEDFDRMNKDHFELEQVLKTTYYEERQRNKEECLLLHQQLEDKQKQLLQLNQMQQQNEQFWDERKREINDLMNDVILNVKDMYRYQELCTIFDPMVDI